MTSLKSGCGLFSQAIQGRRPVSGASFPFLSFAVPAQEGSSSKL